MSTLFYYKLIDLDGICVVHLSSQQILRCVDTVLPSSSYVGHITKSGSDLSVVTGLKQAALYYTILESSQIYTIAVFLDPRLKSDYLGNK
jgi:hypothetical protein